MYTKPSYSRDIGLKGKLMKVRKEG